VLGRLRRADLKLEVSTGPMAISCFEKQNRTGQNKIENFDMKCRGKQSEIKKKMKREKRNCIERIRNLIVNI
jgi:hypothetical protein